MRCQENSFSLFAADDLQRVRAARFQLACQPLNQKKVFGDAKPTKSLSETKSAAYLVEKKPQYGHVSSMMTARSLSLLAPFTPNNGHPVSDALHKSNRLPVCLPVGVGERSETAVSVPASCSLPLSVSPQPRLISAFQLSLILLLHCPPHKEFGGGGLQTLPLCSAAGKIYSAHCLLSAAPES